MRLISRHILRSLIPPFLWGVAALTGLLILNQLAQLIDRFGGKGLPFSVMLEAFVLILPPTVTLTLPMAVLIATLYAFSQLAANLEMVAMYANGLSVWRMARPALVGAAFVAVANFLLYDQIVPLSNSRFAALQNDVGRVSPALALRPMALNPLPEPPLVTMYILQAARIDPGTGRMEDITIYDLGYYNARRVVRARRGEMRTSDNHSDLLLSLQDGEVVEFKAGQPGRIEQTLFSRDRYRIRDVANQLERRADRGDRDDRSMSSCQLLDEISDARWLRDDALDQSAFRARQDLRFLAGLPALPPPSVKVKPTFPPHCGIYRTFGKWVEGLILPTKAAAQQPPQGTRIQQTPIIEPGSQQARQLVPDPDRAPQALRNPSGLPTTSGDVLGLRDQVRARGGVVQSYAVEYQKKFAIPLASFCFVLLGLSLALKYPRSGIGLVIGGSLTIFLSFYILLIGGENLAKKGYLAPWVAIQMPLMLFTMLGLLAVRAANREMGTTRTAGIWGTLVGSFRGIGRRR